VAAGEKTLTCPATCNTAYWSAAPADAFSDGTDFLLKQLNIKKSPVRACPKTASR
jgi:hypothetical protein